MKELRKRLFFIRLLTFWAAALAVSSPARGETGVDNSLYAREDLKKRLEDNRDKIKIKYLEYDWSLNGR
jgi:hypothetical protein